MSWQSDLTRPVSQVFHDRNRLLDLLGAYGIKADLIRALLRDQAQDIPPALLGTVNQAATAAELDCRANGASLNKHVLFGMDPAIDLGASKPQVTFLAFRCAVSNCAVQ